MQKQQTMLRSVRATIDLRKQCGFSQMAQTVLATIVAMTTATGAIYAMNANHEKQLALKEAENLRDFQTVAGQFFINNRNAMLQAMQDGTDANKYCVVNATAYDQDTGVFTGTVVNDTAKHTCAFDATVLKFKDMWPKPAPQSDRDHYVAVFKRIYKPGPDNVLGTADDEATSAVSILFVKANFDGQDNPEPESQTFAAKSVLGASGGMTPKAKIGECDAGQACGNGWKVNLNDYL